MFSIVPGSPGNSGICNIDDVSAWEALETAARDDDRAVFRWNGLEFLLSYRYDISLMALDIVEVIENIEWQPTGAIDVAWPTNGFPYVWRIHWDGREVRVHAEARPEPAAVDLTGRDSVSLPQAKFLEELRGLLRMVARILRGAGYSPTGVDGFERLLAVAGQ